MAEVYGNRPSDWRLGRHPRFMVVAPDAQGKGIGLSGLAGCGCKDKEQIIIQQSPLFGDVSEIPTWVWIAGVAALLLLMKKR